jgi:dienelactone hydrolase
MKKIVVITLAISFMSCFQSHAAIQTKIIEYEEGTTILEGFLAYDDAIEGERPGILVVHDWMGFGEWGNQKAEELAKAGYVALAVDIYGKGVRPKNADEASQQAGLYKNDRTLLRKRVWAGLEALKNFSLADSRKIGAIGYCFGGTTVLELARSGADIRGVVSFHGGLNTPTLEDANNIKAKVLVLHGADDPYVPSEEVKAFQKEMTDARVDWQMVYYSGAVHSFTKPDAGNDPSKGAAYNPLAAERSWQAMKTFFNEIF